MGDFERLEALSKECSREGYDIVHDITCVQKDVGLVVSKTPDQVFNVMREQIMKTDSDIGDRERDFAQHYNFPVSLIFRASGGYVKNIGLVYALKMCVIYPAYEEKKKTGCVALAVYLLTRLGQKVTPRIKGIIEDAFDQNELNKVGCSVASDVDRADYVAKRLRDEQELIEKYSY